MQKLLRMFDDNLKLFENFFQLKPSQMFLTISLPSLVYKSWGD